MPHQTSFACSESCRAVPLIDPKAEIASGQTVAASTINVSLPLQFSALVVAEPEDSSLQSLDSQRYAQSEKYDRKNQNSRDSRSDCISEHKEVARDTSTDAENDMTKLSTKHLFLRNAVSSNRYLRYLDASYARIEASMPSKLLNQYRAQTQLNRARPRSGGIREAFSASLPSQYPYPRSANTGPSSWYSSVQAVNISVDVGESTEDNEGARSVTISISNPSHFIFWANSGSCWAAPTRRTIYGRYIDD